MATTYSYVPDIPRLQHTLTRIQSKIDAAIAAGQMCTYYGAYNGQLLYAPIYPTNASEPHAARLREQQLADAYKRYYSALWLANAIEWRGKSYI